MGLLEKSGFIFRHDFYGCGFSKIVQDNAFKVILCSKEKINKSCPLEYKISQGKWKNKNSLTLYRFLHRCLNSYNCRVEGLHIHMKFQQMKIKASLVNDVSTEIKRVTRCRG